jgi:alcohol/geraniol dehydrogenase (NADP+)
MAAMLDFAIRHNITSQVDHFSLNTVYDAIEHLVSGKPRYRVVLDVA